MWSDKIRWLNGKQNRKIFCYLDIFVVSLIKLEFPSY